MASPVEVILAAESELREGEFATVQVLDQGFLAADAPGF